MKINTDAVALCINGLYFLRLEKWLLKKVCYKSVPKAIVSYA